MQEKKSIWRADVQNIESTSQTMQCWCHASEVWPNTPKRFILLHLDLMAGCWKPLRSLRSLESCKCPSWLLALTKFLERPIQILPISSKSPAAWRDAAQILFKIGSVLVLIHRIISITLHQDLMGYHNEQELVIALCWRLFACYWQTLTRCSTIC